MKKLISIIKTLAIIIVMVFAISLFFWRYTSYNILRYNALVEKVGVFPKINELGDYDKLRFKYFHQRYFIFADSKVYTLKVTYDDDEYKAMKQHLNIAYKYQKEPLSGIGYGNDIEPNSPKFELGSFTFRVLKNTEYGTLRYPKEIFIIGTSDKDNQVAFIYFRDFDLDCIESLPDFLIGYCGW